MKEVMRIMYSGYAAARKLINILFDPDTASCHRCSSVVEHVMRHFVTEIAVNY